MAELDSQPKSIQSLYAWYAEGRLWVNRRYQRKLVWTLEEKQRLIESALRRFPIPAILLAERDGGEYEVIDGLQRLHTLMSFIEMGFPTLDGKYFAVAEFPTANTRAGEGAFDTQAGQPLLAAREVGTFLDYTLAVSVMRGANTGEIDDVFGRINTYGHRLSDQERRQAGVQNPFSALVRELACELRGDASLDEVTLSDMPSISIDLPLAKHGYQVSASEVFWVAQGILRSTDLRDSMDEQCIADIVACIVGGQLIPRSKDALDEIYQSDGAESTRIEVALQAYGADKFRAEFKYVLDEIQKVVAAGDGRMRDLLFRARTTNPFPALFTVVFIAFHQSLIGDGKIISDVAGINSALKDLNARVSTSRGSTTVPERNQNVNMIKGMIAPSLVPGSHATIYGDVTSFDIDEALRRSEIEAAHYELKQGILRLDETNSIDPDILPKLMRTACAIANNGKDRAGTIYVGVADKDSDVDRIKQLYGIQPRQVGRRFVVGIKREMDALGESAERYVARVRQAFEASQLSEPLKSSILSSLTYSDYYGLGVLVIHVPSQGEPSSDSGKIYTRVGDRTEEATGLDIVAVTRRFA